MFSTVLAKLESLGHLFETAMMLTPVFTAVCGWLLHRLRYQRRYVRLLHRMQGIADYKRRLRELYRKRDTDLQLRIEALLETVCLEIGLNLQRHCLSPTCCFVPLERNFLMRAVRLLESPTYCWLCERLLLLLGNALQSLLEIRLFHQRPVPKFNIGQHAAERTAVYRDWQAKCEAVKRQLWIIRQYLQGNVAIDHTTDSLGPRAYLVDGDSGGRIEFDCQLDRR